MQTNISTHPHPDELRAFLEGRLHSTRQEEVERHVEVCSDCCNHLMKLPMDSLVERLRTSETLTLEATPSIANAPLNTIAAETISQRIPEELRNHPRYRVIGKLGAGGMGVVYRGEHRLMERAVALKVLNPRLLKNPAAVERFRVEVRAAARLSHPNIVAAWDADEAGGLQMLVMEFIEGISIARQVEKAGPIPTRHACSFARQAAIGLQHAFEKGMVHRDIKPQNLMLTRDGCVKILDFGLARFAQERIPAENSSTVASKSGTAAPEIPAGLTRDGSALGTPEFMAPEQILNARTADIRADIFSLGCTLFFMLSGRSPFAQAAALARLISPLNRQAPDIRAALPDIPTALATLIKDMLATDPADRPQIPADVANALEPFCKPAPPAQPPPSPKTTPARAAKPPRQRKIADLVSRRRATLSVLAALLTVTLLLTAFPKQSSSPGPSPIQASSRPPRQDYLLSTTRILIILPHKNATYPLLDTLRRSANYFKASLTIAGFQLQPAQILISNVNPEDFDGVIFLGPADSPTELLPTPQETGQLQQLAKHTASASRPVGAIGSGVQLLAKLGCLAGRRASRSAQSATESADGLRVNWTWQTVVIDGHWITSADTTASKQVLEAVVKTIRGARPK